MRYKIITGIAILIFLSLFTQCKKDYPSDTPKWVTKIIQEFKKVSPGCLCYDATDCNPTISIVEYRYNGEVLYSITHDCCYRGPYVYIYSQNGEYWDGCRGLPVISWHLDSGYSGCDAYISEHCTSQRLIWSGQMY